MGDAHAVHSDIDSFKNYLVISTAKSLEKINCYVNVGGAVGKRVSQVYSLR